MSLKSIEIKRNYNSGENNIIEDFFIPVLSEAKIYKRAVGFFTAKSLVSYARGIVELVKKNGCFELIVSPSLEKEDIEAMIKGYIKKDEVIKEKILNEIFNTVLTDDELDYLNLLSNLISINKLHIKIAYNPNGIYHEKIGIVIDDDDNYITFQGSLNETYNAQFNNYESFTVHFSWQEVSCIYAKDIYDTFERHWSNKTNGLEVIDFPESLKREFIKKYNNIKNIDELLNKIKNKSYVTVEEGKLEYNDINLPSYFAPRYYQIEAIDLWSSNEFRGMLSMATGTGKTLTALYGAKKLWDNLENKKLVIIIVVPYKILIEQWSKDVESFNIKVIKVSSDYNWFQHLNDSIRSINFEVINRFAIITTISSFQTDRMQRLIDEIKVPILFIGDEAHNLGTYNIINKLPKNAQFRLGLTATPNRHFDSIGTKKVKDYFHGIVYTFGLDKAISEGYLVPYYYYPKIVYLTDKEMDNYNKITEKIIKILGVEDECEIFEDDIPEHVKRLLINRARIVAGAINKIPVLVSLMEKYKNEKHKLIYCGATTVESLEDDTKDIRQIDLVIQKLNDIGIWASKYTSNEDQSEREWILNAFGSGDIDTLVAIKCLDEGVNIPQIHKAFILASSTNKKEFIQRRGRILRKSEGKKFATIFDFITFPSKETSQGRGLVIRELIRYKEFMDLAINSKELFNHFQSICKFYNININDIGGNNND